MNEKKFLALLLGAVLTLETHQSLAAEMLPQLPSSVERAGIQPIQPQQAPKTEPETPLAGKPTEPALPIAAQKIKFKLNKLTVTGVTVYKPEQLAEFYKNYLGKEISLADLQIIADNITKHYRDDGYLLSKAIIPAQKINNGVVQMQVIEGYIANVTIAGNPRGAYRLVESYGQHLKEQHPINVSTLERYVLLINDIPGLDVRSVLSPATSTATQQVSAGATDATLITDEHMASGYFGYDNRGTAYLGPFEYSFGGSINSIFRSGDQTSFQGLMTTRTQQLQYYRLSHQTPLGTQGLQLNIAGSYSRSRPGNVPPPGQPLAFLQVQGTNAIYSLGLNYPVIRTRAKNLYVSATLDASYSASDILGINQYTDKIRSLRIGSTFNNTDSWLGSNQIGGQISQGLPILDNSPLDQIDNQGFSNLSRKDGHSVYTKINLDASRTQWLGATNLSVLAAATGQYAFQALLVAEQFSYGGSQYGQAYDPAQFTGDSGVAGKLEMRYDQDINWRVLNHIQYFTFYDIGQVWNFLPGTMATPASGASAGAGVRTQFNKYLSGYVQWAQPLTAPAGAQLSKTGRMFFGITVAGDTPSGNPATPNLTATTPPPQAYVSAVHPHT